MKRKFKQLLNIKKTDHDIFVGKLCPGLRHAKNVARLNHLMDRNPPLLIIESPKVMHIKINDGKKPA
jgi:hypothetical protein